MAWIRSQNGDILLDASMFWVKSYGELSACIGSDWNKGRSMGKFPTEEQAIEELNRIQEWIKERGSSDASYQIPRPRPDNPKETT